MISYVIPLYADSTHHHRRGRHGYRLWKFIKDSVRSIHLYDSGYAFTDEKCQARIP